MKCVGNLDWHGIDRSWAGMGGKLRNLPTIIKGECTQDNFEMHLKVPKRVRSPNPQGGKAHSNSNPLLISRIGGTCW